MKNNNLVTLFALILLCAPVAAFDTAFNGNELVHYNQSYLISTRNVNSVPDTVWIVTVLLGIGVLILSTIGDNYVALDLYSIFASLFFLLGAYWAFAVDTVTGYGTVLVNTTSGREYVTLINHTIYHYDLWGVMCGILFIIALANQWRLWLDWKRVEPATIQ